MAITKQKKTELLKTAGDILKSATSVVFVNFHGLTVADTGELRTDLRGVGAGYKVLKKTLMRKAFAEAGIAGIEPALDGELALAFGTDAILPAKGVVEFRKKHKETISILGGIFDRSFVSASAIESLAVIPSREVLLGRLASVLNAPIQGAVSALGAVMPGFVRVLNARVKSLG